MNTIQHITNELAETKEALERLRRMYTNLLDSNAKLSIRDFSKVTRVEVIDKTGRAYVNRNTHSIEMSIQDDDRTMKLFLN